MIAGVRLFVKPRTGRKIPGLAIFGAASIKNCHEKEQGL